MSLSVKWARNLSSKSFAPLKSIVNALKFLKMFSLNGLSAFNADRRTV